MKLVLERSGENAAVALLRTSLPSQAQALSVRYETRTGALLRVDGIVAGAFDREHRDVLLPPSDTVRELTLEVEVQSLPTNGLPAGPGLIWWYLNARSRAQPQMRLSIVPASRNAMQADGSNHGLPVIGHSHLDVAWLWTYEQTARKAERTFAIACDLIGRDSTFRFAQSQPQLYRFVEQADAELFERVRAYVAEGRFDAQVAALWVESDCNIPSGESLLRQMLFAYEYTRERFGLAPSIAWLPDSFGFARTLPQLLAHAGIAYFATTKLQWNDTTKFPYPQFVWEGPDGSGVVAALMQSYDGAPYPWRIARARQRHEPLVVGYGDGGGGVTTKMLHQVPHFGHWIRPEEWFEDCASRRDALPVHRDELYLEYHRGVYTTHHEMKVHNALLERSLMEAEELVSWCIAVHAPRATAAQLAQALSAAWEIVLRNQFHDVLPGTSITPVYEEARQEYAQAQTLVAGAIAAAQTILPRMRTVAREPSCAAPRPHDDVYAFDNGLLHAKVRRDGSIIDLAAGGARNVCTRANVLTLYRDTPKAWEAWNIDAGYEASASIVGPRDARVEEGALRFDLHIGASPATMRIELRDGEPFLRVGIEVDWRERARLLRVENQAAFACDLALFGAPHGMVERSTHRDSPAERARYEVPGQRFAALQDDTGDGFAVFALDTYGWSARLCEDRVHLGHSLLRSTSWPDPQADRGLQELIYAFVPFSGATIGQLEHAWTRFAHEPRVRLFEADTDAVLVVACKPAQNGDGVIVRVRECDGKARAVRLRCAARMTVALPVDGLERAAGDPVAMEGEHMVFDLGAFALRSFRVRFSDAA